MTTLTDIAAAAAEGLDLPDIAARLNLSPQFVEWVVGADSFRLVMEKEQQRREREEDHATRQQDA